MKKLLLVLLALPFISLNAQIFINTNPDVTGSEKRIIKKDASSETNRVELNTTNTTNEVVTTKTKPVTSTTTSTSTTTISKPVTNTTTSTSTPAKRTTTISKPVTNTTPSTSIPTKRTTSTSTTKPAKSSSFTNNSARNTTTSSTGSNVPPNAEAGKCYARCQTEDQYTYKTKQVVSSPKMTKRIQLPALYTTVYDTIVIRPKSTDFVNVPAEYENIKEQKMVAPATTKWIKGKANAGCLSANPDDCQVMCLVEVPAQYKTVTKKVLKHQSYKREITVPMEYNIVAKQVKTQNERFVEQVIPATYKTAQERVLVSKGGYQGWKEVLCGSDLTSSKITSIQKALKAAGYDPGPIDNVLGTQTKDALKSYQRAKGLPVGNLNIETLKALGVN